MTSFNEFMVRFAAAVLAGALVGLERERARLRSSRSKELPGLRSFGLLSAYGAITGYVYERGFVAWAGVALTTGIICVALLYTAYRLLVQRVGGVTTPIVMLLVYSLGLAAGLGYVTESVAASAVITLLLALKTPVARLVRAVSYEELLAIFELALFYLALAPLVYNLNITLAGVRLSVIYTFFLLVLSVSFIGYLAWRAGASAELYAFLGGLVNSEATVAIIASRARDPEALEKLLPYVHLGLALKTVALSIAAVALSQSRLLAEQVAPWLLIPLAVDAALALTRRSGYELRLPAVSPLELGLALKTVAIYTGLLLAAALLKPVLSRPEALIAYSALGGFVSATATVFAVAAYLPAEPRLHALAYSVVTASAMLNKPLYARTASPSASRATLRLSLVFAAPFLATAAAACIATLR